MSQAQRWAPVVVGDPGPGITLQAVVRQGGRLASGKAIDGIQEPWVPGASLAGWDGHWGKTGLAPGAG